MIDFVYGVLRDRADSYVVIEAAGIGYRINIGLVDSSLVVGEYVKLYTHYIHKEDLVELYGFYTPMVREVFRHLITVSGIGAKLAMRILSDLTCEEVINAVLNKDSLSFTRVSGLGKKGAEKLILELENKFKKNYSHFTISKGSGASSINRTAVEALIALGYGERESIEAVSLALKETKGRTTEDIIKESLKLLAKLS